MNRADYGLNNLPDNDSHSTFNVDDLVTVYILL